MSQKVLCLWCGNLFRAGNNPAPMLSYCSRTHRDKASKRRRDRRRWKFQGCDAPHAPFENDRGPAIALARKTKGELFVCKCGRYHVVEPNGIGRSPELGTTAGAVHVPAEEASRD